MFEEFETKTIKTAGAKIKIIGVGGGGNNAVNIMYLDKIPGLTFVVANTDDQALLTSPIPTKLLLGEDTTKGLGAGASPETGKQAAVEVMENINKIVMGQDLIFIAAGLGGGTGTGAAPVIAKAAKDNGCLTIAIVTTPFGFEGETRARNAEAGLKELSANVDAYIVVSNDRLLEELGEISLTDSFKYSDAILKQAVRTISDIIQQHSLINLDFADIKAVLKDAGPAMIGVGRAEGEAAAIEAALKAVNSPILESSIEGATNAIINVAGSSKSLSIFKAKEAVRTVKEAATSNVDTIFGVTINEDLGPEIVVSVIAAGINTTKTTTASRKRINKESYINDDSTNIENYRMLNTQEIDTKQLNTLLDEQSDEFDLDALSFLDDTSEVSPRKGGSNVQKSLKKFLK